MAKTSDRAVRVLANTFYVRLQGVTRLLLYLLLGGLLLVLEALAVMSSIVLPRVSTPAPRVC